ncbi:MAG TPA: 2-amino-4-hydroxy-6-hydroxymethyldihydropteridine diphosphokinase [Candidatus Dormibacteraeota bacterium]|nr:2-amino-4-hydroxy-6-hydroxymethyldihydropteridine diphosphokinase [Candidatus Dormibacteraeota bacterium]
MTLAYLGLGANLGDRAASLARAEELLSDRGVRVLRRSDTIETEPWGVLDQPRFLNLVLEVEWGDDPHGLLRAAKEVEVEAGRTPTFRWGPRVVDVDILLFGDQTVDEPDLQIPHPRMRERDFVLVPLRQLRPDL